MVPSQPVLALTSYCMLRGEVSNINFVVFGLTTEDWHGSILLILIFMSTLYVGFISIESSTGNRKNSLIVKWHKLVKKSIYRERNSIFMIIWYQNYVEKCMVKILQKRGGCTICRSWPHVYLWNILICAKIADWLTFFHLYNHYIYRRWPGMSSQNGDVINILMQ